MKLKNTNKEEIVEFIHTFNSYDFAGEMEQVAKIFNFKNWFKEVYQKNNPYNNLNIDNYFKFKVLDRVDFGSYGDWDTIVFEIYGYRYETNEEYNKRIEINKKKSESAKLAAKTREETKRKRELTLYNNLKAKYET